MHRILPFVILMAIYLAFSANLELANILLGVLIVMGIITLLRPRRQPLNWSRIPGAFLALAAYLGILIKNVVLSGIQVTRIVLQPKMPLKAGITTFPPECTSDLGRAIGAHAISLAPGELLIEMDPDGTMYIHSLDVEASEKLVSASQARRRDLLKRVFD